VNYIKQVAQKHYFSSRYLRVGRLSTYFKIIELVVTLKPERILEIGPGNHFLSNILRGLGFLTKTLDFDPYLKPDFLMSVTDPKIAKLKKNKFELVIASQVMEHVKYKDFLVALENLRKIAPFFLMTLPYTTRNSLYFSIKIKLPFFQKMIFQKKIIWKKDVNKFNGQHYWEIGKRGYGLKRVMGDIKKSGWNIQERFMNEDNPYHYFFLLKTKGACVLN